MKLFAFLVNDWEPVWSDGGSGFFAIIEYSAYRHRYRILVDSNFTKGGIYYKRAIEKLQELKQQDLLIEETKKLINP